MSLSDWLKLNVGGKTFLTTRSTLTSCPDSTFAKMFSPDSGLPPAYSRDGVYYLDTNPDCFSIILDWLRYRYYISCTLHCNALYCETQAQVHCILYLFCKIFY